MATISERLRCHIVARGVRSFGKKRGGYRGGILVLDPVMAWGSTASMGPKQLLDAIDRASRAGATLSHGSNHQQLWERLSCRCQALMLALSPPELCRALFGFHRARCSDAELLAAACDALLSEKNWDFDEGDGTDATFSDMHKLGNHTAMSANDVAMLLKAFSKHGYKDNLDAIDFLLHRASQTLPDAAVTDISQLLAAMVRLGLEDRFGGGVDEASRVQPPHPGLLNQLFMHARGGLFDRFTPASDVTNLCIAVAKLPATQQGSRLLLDMADKLGSDAGFSYAAKVAPRDVLRRLQAIVVAKGLGESGPIWRRLSADQQLRLCKNVAASLGHRCSELDSVALVGALQAFADLLQGLEEPSAWEMDLRTSSGWTLCSSLRAPF